MKRLFEHDDARRLPPSMVERIEDILLVLDAAAVAEDLGLPGFRLHPLKGERKGYYAVTVSANWRIVFRFESGDAYDVDLVDYH